jgi:hypothetical protein
MKALLKFLQKHIHRSNGVLQLWRRLSLRYFNRSCRHIAETPPLQQGDKPFALVTLLQHVDVIQYLVAVKSFCHSAVTPAEIHIVNDGSLTEEDKRFLRQQIPFVTIAEISEVDTGKCPTGGCWERLKYIVDLSQRIYVIQLDADTISVAVLKEVILAIDADKSFILGTPTGCEIVTCAVASEFAHSRDHQHIQFQAERALSQLDMAQGFYIRGCAGFAGFAKGAIQWPVVQTFSQQMQQLVEEQGASWSDWGTEQVTSNFLLANTIAPMVLNEPVYLNSHGQIETPDTHFYHFLGTFRFCDDKYRSLALKFIAEQVSVKKPAL